MLLNAVYILEYKKQHQKNLEAVWEAFDIFRWVQRPLGHCLGYLKLYSSVEHFTASQKFLTYIKLVVF